MKMKSIRTWSCHVRAPVNKCKVWFLSMPFFSKSKNLSWWKKISIRCSKQNTKIVRFLIKNFSWRKTLFPSIKRQISSKVQNKIKIDRHLIPIWELDSLLRIQTSSATNQIQVVSRKNGTKRFCTTKIRTSLNSKDKEPSGTTTMRLNWLIIATWRNRNSKSSFKSLM